MPVEQVPGFWDYLGQGIQRGVEMHRQNEAIQREEAHKKTAEAQGAASLVGQLFQSGAVDSNALQGALSNAGIQGPVVIPSKAEKRQKALAGGPAAIDALTDEEKKDLGFTSSAQQATEKAQISEANLGAKKGELLTKYLNGDKLTDQEAAGVGVLGPSDLELKKLGQLDPYLGGLGERYVAGQLVKTGGRIDPTTAASVAENAYASYVAERSANGLGSLSPEQVAYTRQYFNRATENALIAQKKLDIDEYQAQSGRIHAQAARQTAGQNSQMQWFGKVTTAMENIRKAQSDIVRANPMVQMALDNPALATTPIVKGALDKYNQLQQTSDAFRGAQGALAQGQIPGNLSQLLDAADQIGAQGAGPAAGGAGTGAPPAGAGRGSPPPAGRGGQGGAPPPADPAVAQGIQLLKSKKGTTAQLKEALKAGSITQAQYDAIIAGAGKP